MFTVVQINHTQANLLAVAKVADRPFSTSLAGHSGIKAPEHKHCDIRLFAVARKDSPQLKHEGNNFSL